MHGHIGHDALRGLQLVFGKQHNQLPREIPDLGHELLLQDEVGERETADGHVQGVFQEDLEVVLGVAGEVKRQTVMCRAYFRKILEIHSTWHNGWVGPGGT